MPEFDGPYGEILLPDDDPPDRAIGEYGELDFLMDWAASLQMAFERLDEPPRPPYLKFVAYGALHEEYDGATGLGVILYCEEADLESGRIGIVPVRDVPFPIVVRRVRTELHQAPLRLNGATRTCWARSRNSSGIEGFLTAKHVLAPTAGVGASVPLGGGRSANVLALAPECFDAALLSDNIDDTTPMNTRWNVAIYDTVSVDSQSGSTPTTVVATTDPLGSWAVSKRLEALSLRFLVDHTGQLGDSGGLVHATRNDGGNDDGIGIYLGAYNPTGQTFSQGYCQNLEQVSELMELELFQL